jgi:hypothetical protein
MDKDRANKIISLVKEAQKLGRQAGEKQYNHLLEQGNKWKVMDGEREIDRMLDVCGIGMLRVPGKSEIVKAFKKIGTKTDNQLVVQDVDSKMLIYKQDKGYGMILWLTNRQEMSVNGAAVDAVADFLTEKGLECYSRTVID